LIAPRAGKGITRLFSYQVFDDIQQGTLCEKLADFRTPAVPVQLVTQNVKYMPAKVRAFWELARRKLPELDSIQVQRTGTVHDK